MEDVQKDLSNFTTVFAARPIPSAESTQQSDQPSMQSNEQEVDAHIEIEANQDINEDRAAIDSKGEVALLMCRSKSWTKHTPFLDAAVYICPWETAQRGHEVESAFRLREELEGGAGAEEKRRQTSTPAGPAPEGLLPLPLGVGRTRMR